MRYCLKSLFFLLLIMASSSVLAEACTYRGALMALEQGNTVRGMALMRMASRDGDKRAIQYFATRYLTTRRLAVKDYQFDTVALAASQRQKPQINLSKR